MNRTNISQDSIEQRLKTIEQQLSLILKKENPGFNEVTYLDLSEAADLLCKSIHTLYGMVSRREIPHIKKGNRLYFNKHALINWLQEGERLPVALK